MVPESGRLFLQIQKKGFANYTVYYLQSEYKYGLMSYKHYLRNLYIWASTRIKQFQDETLLLIQGVLHSSKPPISFRFMAPKAPGIPGLSDSSEEDSFEGSDDGECAERAFSHKYVDPFEADLEPSAEGLIKVAAKVHGVEVGLYWPQRYLTQYMSRHMWDEIVFGVQYNPTDGVTCSSVVSCLPNQYQCPDGNCIPSLWRCDGDKDCPGGADELACPKVAPCSGFRCTDGLCVALTWKCDGHSDCADGSDEDLLTCGNITCPDSKFHCKNGQCMSAMLVCNGQNDCTDGSDEVGCPPKQCSQEEFSCGLACLSLDVMCDGKVDCAEGQDESEERCKVASRPQCPTDEFSCDNHCVPQAWRCDGHTDCEDKSDEDNCGSELFILIFNTSVVTKVDLTGEKRDDMPIQLGRASDLTGDLGSSEIYWIDEEQEGIFGQHLDKTLERRQIVKHVGKSECLSVDWIYKLVFWIDAESRTISVASLDGLKRRVLYREDISLPSAIAVDPLTGFIFWSDMGETAKIEKVAMNGNSRTPLVTVDIHRPVALTLDIKHSYVYWIDSELNTVSKIGMDGLHRKVVLRSKEFLANPSGIAVFEEKIFWSDIERQAIYSMPRRIHANITTVTSMKDPAGLIILAREVQADGLNLCLELRAECPFLCVPSPLDPEHTPAFSCLSSDILETDNISTLPNTVQSLIALILCIGSGSTDGCCTVNSTVSKEHEVSSNRSLLISVLANHTSSKEGGLSYNRSSVIAVSVFFSFFLISCMIIRCHRKTRCNIFHTKFFESSKKYLKPDLGRTVSSAYMLTDLKNEDEDD
ncbi:uncharacterized protein WCC33_001063 [Rhinophrynus dorsalis]